MYILISILFFGLIIIFAILTFLYVSFLDELKYIFTLLKEIKLIYIINNDYFSRCLEDLIDDKDLVDIPEFMKDRKE